MLKPERDFLKRLPQLLPKTWCAETLKDRFTVFQVCLKQQSWAQMNTDAGLAHCNNSFCSSWPLEDPFQIHFQCMRMMGDKIYNPPFEQKKCISKAYLKTVWGFSCKYSGYLPQLIILVKNKIPLCDSTHLDGSKLLASHTVHFYTHLHKRRTVPHHFHCTGIMKRLLNGHYEQEEWWLQEHVSVHFTGLLL